jgi:hypothetical protein
MRAFFARLSLIVATAAAPAAVAAAPAGAGAPPTATQTRPAPREYWAEFGPRETTITIPDGGVLLLDGRPATEKAAFLGVSVTNVSPELREQLKLRRGVGLVVNHVEAGSPAEAAGVKRFDVLERLDDQVLIEPRQLSVLIRLRGAGDEVKLGVVREAKPLSLTAKLAVKDLPPLEDVLVPTSPRWRTVPIIKGGVSTNLDFLPEGTVSGMTWSDGELNMEVLQDHGRRLVARDKAGTVLFEGAIDTAEQMQNMPETVRGKAIRFLRTSGAMNPSTTQPTATQPVNLHYRNTMKPIKIDPVTAPRPPSPAM